MRLRRYCVKIALVYDRLNKIGGAEYVLQEFAALYPEADWYTSVWEPSQAPFSRLWKVHPSFLNKISLLRTHHEWVPYLMPFVFESFDFSGYDVVISITSAEAKGIITRPETLHLCYCLTPTRYLYNDLDTYIHDPLSRLVAKKLRDWDQVAAIRPDIMIAISEHVKKRIKKYYNRDSEVIYPPVDIKKFSVPIHESKIINHTSEFYLTVSRLVPSKRLDILVQAFNKLGRRLVIIGSGVEAARLKKQAEKNITFLGKVADEDLVKYYQGCQAFVTAAEEDFGIAMVEALAAGRPVIAWRKGGAAEIVKDGVTGILVQQGGSEPLQRAVQQLDTMHISSDLCRESAEQYGRNVWRTKIKERIEAACKMK